MRNKNKLNIRLKIGGIMGRSADPLSANGSHGGDNGGGTMRYLANGAVRLRLMSLVAMERFYSGKTQETG